VSREFYLTAHRNTVIVAFACLSMGTLDSVRNSARKCRLENLKFVLVSCPE
jgi:hypothetical protein